MFPADHSTCIGSEGLFCETVSVCVTDLRMCGRHMGLCMCHGVWSVCDQVGTCARVSGSVCDQTVCGRKCTWGVTRSVLLSLG